MKSAKLRDIGEFGIIDKLKKKFKGDASVKYSIGEDAAVISYSRTKYLLFASDMLVEDVHFKIENGKDIFFKIGHKALACNISDIAAMGGVPKYAVVSLGLRPDMKETEIWEIFSGLKKTARKFDVNIVGGDLSKAEKIVIDVSVIGFVEKKKLTLRSKAETGDIIFVTGRLGGSGKGRHLSFVPRLKEARQLVKNYKINSMIDISDGLIQDLGHILELSKKGAVLYEGLIPIADETAGLEAALYEGEDFELLFTVSVETAGRIIKDKKIRVYEIGEVVKDRRRLDIISKTGVQTRINPNGFRHF